MSRTASIQHSSRKCHNSARSIGLQSARARQTIVSGGFGAGWTEEKGSKGVEAIRVIYYDWQQSPDQNLPEGTRNSASQEDPFILGDHSLYRESFKNRAAGCRRQQPSLHGIVHEMFHDL